MDRRTIHLHWFQLPQAGFLNDTSIEVYLLKTELSLKTIFKESIFKLIGQIIYATGHCVVSTAAMDSRLMDS